LYQSNQVTKTTKKVRPIDDADLACHILHMCPGTRQAQCKLKADMVPQGVRDLQDDLDKIKEAFSMEREQLGKKGKSNPSDAGKHKMLLIHEPIPKPCTNVKHCTLCKKHGRHACDSQHVGLLQIRQGW
jgi:hypothetical protein